MLCTTMSPRSLDVSHNSLTGAVRWNATTTMSLRTLLLSYNSFTDWPFLAPWSQCDLQALDISGTGLDFVNVALFLENCGNLTSLGVASLGLTDKGALESLSTEALTALDVSHNAPQTDPLLTALYTRWPGLRYVSPLFAS